MVKTMLLTLSAIISLILFAILGLILWSQRTPSTLGLSAEGLLQPCPNKPNCVCSEAPSNIDSIAFKDDYASAWQQLKNALENNGGQIKKQTDTYLWATFSTPLLHFVDDVEARLDIKNKTIHLRSASRVGHSDLGRNKNRTNEIKATFEQSQLQSDSIDR